MAILFIFRNNGDEMQLPVNPSELEICVNGKNETVEIVRLGEINILRDVALKTISMETYLPIVENHPAVLTKSHFKPPSEYIQFFQNTYSKKEPVEITITDIDLYMKMSLEKFNWKMMAQDDDVHISLDLKEYKDYKVTTIPLPNADNSPPSNMSTASNEKPHTSTTKAVTIGCDVMINGQLHRDSGGSAPGQTKSNYKGKVNLIKKGSAFPYHVTTPEGSALGWVSELAVEVIN